jgi:hypothetical protein
MNIFVTDVSPQKSAIYLDDKRVKHMPKECIELLCIHIHRSTGRWLIPFPYWNANKRDKDMLYTHPITFWVARDRKNFTWLFEHLQYLTLENIHRFNEMDTKIIMVSTVIRHMYRDYFVNLPPTNFRNSSLYKNEKDIVAAYRKTMIHKWTVTDKIKPAVWTKREPPYWLLEQIKLEL